MASSSETKESIVSFLLGKGFIKSKSASFCYFMTKDKQRIDTVYHVGDSSEKFHLGANNGTVVTYTDNDMTFSVIVTTEKGTVKSSVTTGQLDTFPLDDFKKAVDDALTLLG